MIKVVFILFSVAHIKKELKLNKKKKEIEQAANLSAISALQTGDKCMVKLTNSYAEKWTMAHVNSILQDTYLAITFHWRT